MVYRKNEFSRALSSAKAALKAKTKQRDRAIAELRQLNLDIPNLERTVRALEAQLGGTGPVTRPTSQSDNKQVGVVPPRIDTLKEQREFVERITEDIPPEIRAQLPPEDFSKFGYHFGTEPPEKEDFLPEITGKELVPEKKA